MAQRFIQAAIPTYKESYVNLPLEFINKQITQDQAAFDKSAAELAALSSLKQDLSPWAEEQGYRNKLMNPYLEQINELSNQLYTTGQVGQVVPQIAKLNQKWTNDELRQQLAKDYEFYDKTYLPWTKQEGYSTAFDEYKTPEGKWNPKIDVKSSTGYKRILWDKDADIHKNLDNWVASSIGRSLNMPGATIEYIGGRPMLVEYKDGKKVNTGINLDTPEYSHYYQGAIDALADQYSTQENDVSLWLQNKVGDRKAIKNYVTNLARQKFHIKTDEESGQENYTPLSDPSGSGSVGTAPSSDLDYTVGPYGTVKIEGEGFDNLKKNIKTYNNNINAKYDQLFNSSVDAFNTNPEIFNNLQTELEVEFDNILKNKGADPKLYENIDNVKAFTQMPTNERYGYLKGILGDKEALRIRNKVLTYNLELATKGSPEIATQDYLNRFFTGYSELNDLEAKRNESERVYNALYDKGFSKNEKEIKNAGLEKNSLNTLSTIIDNKGFWFTGEIRGPESEKRLEVDTKYLPILDELGIKYSDKSHDGYITSQAWGFYKKKVKFINDPEDIRKIKNAFVFKDKIDKDIKAGNITLTQDEYIRETEGVKKGDEGHMYTFTEKFKESLNNDNQILIQLAQYTGAIDPTQSSPGNIDNVKKLFERSSMKDNDFEWTDGKMVVSDVKFRRYSSTSLPSLFVTIKNKEGGEDTEAGSTSTAIIHLDKNNKSQIADIIPEMLSDEDPVVNAIGAEWYGAAILGDVNLGKIRTFFDIEPSKETEGVPLSFKGEDGNTYVGRIGKAIDGKYYREFGKLNTQTGTIEPLATQKNSEGQLINVSDVKNSYEALQIIGFYNYGKVQGNSQWSSGGGSVEKDLEVLQ